MDISAYIDESGDTGYTSKSTRFFIITVICTHDVVSLRRIARDVHGGKRTKNKANQLHTHKESDKTRKRILKKVEKLSIRCVVSVIDKNLIFVADPYLYTLQKVAVYLHTHNISNVILAKRDTRKNYNKNIINLFLKYNISVTLTSPVVEKALQISDFYSWSVFSHLEHNKSDYFHKFMHITVFI